MILTLLRSKYKDGFIGPCVGGLLGQEPLVPPHILHPLPSLQEQWQSNVAIATMQVPHYNIRACMWRTKL